MTTSTAPPSDSIDGTSSGAPSDEATSTSALQRLREIAPQLNRTTGRIAATILADPLRAGRASITEIASAAGASAATVSRLATRLGYPGYPALRSAIALDNGRTTQSGWERDIGSEISPQDRPREVLDILAGTAARALRDAAAAIDVHAFDRAAGLIAHADRVHVYGEWADAIALRELQMRLLRIGMAVWFHEAGGYTLRVVAATLTERDAVIVLGRSGKDEAGITLLRRAQEAGAHAIALHGDADSALAEAAEIPLYTGIRSGPPWTQTYAGRASDVLATSYLWLLVAQKRSSDPTMRYIDDGTFFDAQTDSRPETDSGTSTSTGTGTGTDVTPTTDADPNADATTDTTGRHGAP